VQERAKQIRADLGDPERIILGVDRLDYTKGIDVRLRAFEELLAEGRVHEADTVFIQLATPSRERVEHYQKMRNDIEQSVGRINGTYAKVGHPVLHYLHQSLPRDELVAFYVASDVMLVTPLRDGMNLVAKEYIACRTDGDGVLVLSEFAGAAIELKDSVLVNPHDTDGVKNALYEALTMPAAESRRRMRTLRRQVLGHDVDRWARSFLDALGLPPPDSA
jgi:trehalose 6-phosphate synthase